MRLIFDLPQCEMFEGGLHLWYGFCLSGSNKAIWRPGVLRGLGLCDSVLSDRGEHQACRDWGFFLYRGC